MAEAAEPPILIAGAGGVGLALALALKRAMPGLGASVVETAAEDGPEDHRAIAIAPASRRMLDRLGVWEMVAPEAQPVSGMAIGDSRTEDVGRPVFLSFDAPEEGEPLAHMVPNGLVLGSLRARAKAAGVAVEWRTEVEDFEAGADRVRVVLRRQGGRSTASPSLVVAADGRRSRLRGFAGVPAVEWGYDQIGLVLTVEHERPHLGRARQDFLPAGPFAVLPLRGNRSSLVWTKKREIAERLLAADPLTLRAELEYRFGHELGEVRPVDALEGFPLRLLIARRFAARRFALAGDAAHVIHPLAGQGLNLGLQDAAALAESVVDAMRLGLDPGSEEVLARYERWRRAEVVEMALATDGLNRLFSNDLPPLRLARDIGLGLVDRLPRLKQSFIRRAAGAGRDAPRLLRGEAI